MNKKIFTVLLLVVAFSANSFAQSRKEIRKAERAAREAAYVASMTEAVRSASFSFSADYLSSGAAQRVPITRGYRTVNVAPDLLNVKLPYFTTSKAIGSPRLIDFQTSDYTYSFDNEKGTFHVNIKVDNINNNQSSRNPQSGTFLLHFMIVASTGSATLTITPNFTAPITYTGAILLN